MALKVADHFYLIEQGRVVFDGVPGEMEERRSHQAGLSRGGGLTRGGKGGGPMKFVRR